MEGVPNNIEWLLQSCYKSSFSMPSFLIDGNSTERLKQSMSKSDISILLIYGRRKLNYWLPRHWIHFSPLC